MVFLCPMHVVIGSYTGMPSAIMKYQVKVSSYTVCAIEKKVIFAGKQGRAENNCVFFF